MDIGSILYFGALTVWSGAVAYYITRRVFPDRIEKEPTPAPQALVMPEPSPIPQAPVPDYHMREGFKAFATDGDLTVEDIVKGLSRRKE